jgi:hypothetical protein
MVVRATITVPATIAAAETVLPSLRVWRVSLLAL